MARLTVATVWVTFLWIKPPGSCACAVYWTWNFRLRCYLFLLMYNWNSKLASYHITATRTEMRFPLVIIFLTTSKNEAITKKTRYINIFIDTEKIGYNISTRQTDLVTKQLPHFDSRKKTNPQVSEVALGLILWW